jgi:lysine/ornithine N-monooxygenase
MTVTKTLTKATPTVDLDGKVTKWDIEVEYFQNEYVSAFSKLVEVEPSKVPASYTKAELWELINEAHLDAVFDSMYESTHSTEEPTESKVDGFDVDSLV